jgi:hypothetical protein
MGTVEDNCDKQDLVSWYDNNINHPQRSLKQLLGIFILSLNLFGKQSPGSLHCELLGIFILSLNLTPSCSTTHSFIPDWG